MTPASTSRAWPVTRPARLTGCAALDVLLDPERLAEAVGRDDVTVTRLRHKPGEYAVAAVADVAGPAGWVRVTDQSTRVRKDVTRAPVGQVRARALPGGLHASSGPLATDPRLMPHLDRALLVRSTVLRHNPLRRLVLRDGDTLVRVSAEAQPRTHWLLDRLADGVAPRRQEHRDDNVTRWEWVAGEPLDESRSVEHARVAGEVLARWHATPLEAVVPRACLRRSARAGLQATAADLSLLDRELGERTRRAVDALPPVEAPVRALLHGDFSADQVVHRGGAVSLVDLDRVCVGDPVHDLASFVAVEMLSRTDPGTPSDPCSDLPLVEALVEGYVLGGGRWPGPRQLAPALALALLSRATEPLRRAEAGWRRGIGATLDLVGEVLR